VVQLSRGGRRGRNLSVRVSESDLADCVSAGYGTAGPAGLGPWLLWRALGSLHVRAMPSRGGNAGSTGQCRGKVLAVPEVQHLRAGRSSSGACCFRRRGSARPGARVVLDLCGGSGAWSRPYVERGYDVRLVTLPDWDVRAVSVGDLERWAPRGVWGVLAAPPCTEFSIAKTRGVRDFAAGLEVVCACLRLVALARPVWWALENPGSGLLRRWLGVPADVFQPCDFGDPWTKLTALWGRFRRPQRRHCRAGRGMPGRSAAERAVTPGGFAAAFCDANP
jgi:hypothetical protein